MDLDVSEVELVDVLRDLALQCGVEAVCEENLDRKPVTVRVVDGRVDSVMRLLSRRVGAPVTRIENVYYFGTVRAEDRAVLVRRVVGLSAEQIKAVLGTVVDVAAAQVLESGVLVLADRAENLRRADDLLVQVMGQESPTWCVQVFVVAATRGDLTDLGLQDEPVGNLAIRLQGSTDVPLAVKWDADATLRWVLRAARTATNMRMVAQPLFLLEDGSEASFVQGDRTPIIKRVVSPEGTVTTQGYEYVQTGLTIRASLREAVGDTVSLKLELDDSQVTGQAEGAPITAGRNWLGTCRVAVGRAALVACLGREDEVGENSGVFGLSIHRDRRSAIWQVWVRAVRIDRTQGVIGGTRATGFLRGRDTWVTSKPE